MAKRKQPEPVEEASPIKETIEAARISRSKPLVFISHDSRDADLAEEFGNLLSDVSGGTLKSFRSSDRKGTVGIEFGAEWYKAIMTKLGDATDVVALLTQHSVDRPWILYETGVAKGKLDTTVLGLAIGIPLEKVNTGPFGQFLNCSDEEDQLTKLVIQLISRNPDASPREESVRRQVKIFRDNVAKLLKDRVKTSTGGKAEEAETSVARLFEEVKVMLNQLPDRIEGSLRQMTRHKSSRMLRGFHPHMLEEIALHPKYRESPDSQAYAWLMFVSTLREELPWLYEPGMEVYHALKSHDIDKFASAAESLDSLLEMFAQGPLPYRMMGLEDEESFIMAERSAMMMHEYLMRLRKRYQVKRTRKTLPDKK